MNCMCGRPIHPNEQQFNGMFVERAPCHGCGRLWLSYRPEVGASVEIRGRRLGERVIDKPGDKRLGQSEPKSD